MESSIKFPKGSPPFEKGRTGGISGKSFPNRCIAVIFLFPSAIRIRKSAIGSALTWNKKKGILAAELFSCPGKRNHPGKNNQSSQERRFPHGESEFEL